VFEVYPYLRDRNEKNVPMLVGQLFATCFYFLAINVAYIVSDISTKAHKG
jgi:hypothetical protein